MDELWDIYTADRVKTGRTIQRKYAVEHGMDEGDFHIVIEIWTMNSRRQVLLTQRHPDKAFGGMWECTGGAVQAGEDSLSAAVRELGEETGIVAEPAELTLLGTVYTGPIIIDSYVVHKDVELPQLHLQPEEVIGAQWVEIEELEDMRAQGLLAPTAVTRLDLYRKKILEKL